MRIFTIILLSCFIVTIGSSQKFAVGAQIGGAYYGGDLSSSGIGDQFRLMNGAIGAVARFQVFPGINLRAGALISKVRGNDKLADNDWQRERNLNFESKIFEVSGIVEVHPIDLFNPDNDLFFSPYIFGGIAYFKFNPQAKYNGKMVDLQPLGTEGQGMVDFPAKQYYELNALAAPFGLGVRFKINHNITVDIEYGARRTDTDYLDDISTNYVAYNELLEENGVAAADLGNKIDAQTGEVRGNPNKKDWYAAPVITFAYGFDLGSLGYSRGKKRRNAQSCPTF